MMTKIIEMFRGKQLKPEDIENNPEAFFGCILRIKNNIEDDSISGYKTCVYGGYRKGDIIIPYELAPEAIAHNKTLVPFRCLYLRNTPRSTIRTRYVVCPSEVEIINEPLTITSIQARKLYECARGIAADPTVVHVTTQKLNNVITGG